MDKIIYQFDPNKNNKLKTERGVSFDEVICAIDNGKLLDVIPHHNKLKYPNQDILVVELYDYVYLVPCVERDDELFLKTIIPSRKHTKKYLKNLGGSNAKEETRTTVE
jgi:hypothetical protein